MSNKKIKHVAEAEERRNGAVTMSTPLHLIRQQGDFDGDYQPDPQTGLYRPSATAAVPARRARPEPAAPADTPTATVTEIAPGASDDTGPLQSVEVVPGVDCREIDGMLDRASEDDDRAIEEYLGEDPEIESKWERFQADAFKQVYWASVGFGVVGQIIGFAQLFQSYGLAWFPAYFFAAVIGGLFEYYMVTAAARAMRKIKQDRNWVEVSLLLIPSACCAAFAAYMNFSHWGAVGAAPLAPFFGGLTVVGYLGEIFDNLFPALRTRRETRERNKARKRIRALLSERREERIRMEQQRLAEEQQRRDREAAEQEQRAQLAGELAGYNEIADKIEAEIAAKPSTTKRRKLSADERIAFGYRHRAATRGQLEKLLNEHKFQGVPGRTQLGKDASKVSDLLNIGAK